MPASLSRVPIDTFMLAGQAAPLPCAICDHENRVTAEHCHRCAAPMSIARQSDLKKYPLNLIATIGAPTACKTAYLGMLMDMLMRQTGGMKTTLLVPHSISLQQATTTALAAGWYPDKTLRDPENTCWVHCRVECGRRRRRVDIVLADFAGEAFEDEMEMPGSFPAVRSILSKCKGILVLADAQRLQSGEHEADYLSLKLLSLVKELQPTSSRWARRRRTSPPLALVFTKADMTPACAQNPLNFAENHASTLWRDCQNRFPKSEVFAASVTGASGLRLVGGRRCRVPLRVEPQGIVEPFGWLIEQLP